MKTYDGVDVLPWFQGEKDQDLEKGTRLFTFSDYHTAPEGTRIRLGRKNGTGEVLTKQGGAYRPEEGSSPGLTPYGLENKPSYVE